MPLQVDAVYENGVLRPLQPLDLSEHEHVLVSVVKAATSGRSSLAVEYIERIKREQQDAEPAPVLRKSGGGWRKSPDLWPLRSPPTVGNVDPCLGISSTRAR
jgi:predicted DNA-binding antitoxin AbrB/MazE fold protein